MAAHRSKNKEPNLDWATGFSSHTKSSKHTLRHLHIVSPLPWHSPPNLLLKNVHKKKQHKVKKQILEPERLDLSHSSTTY